MQYGFSGISVSNGLRIVHEEVLFLSSKDYPLEGLEVVTDADRAGEVVNVNGRGSMSDGSDSEKACP